MQDYHGDGGGYWLSHICEAEDGGGYWLVIFVKRSPTLTWYQSICEGILTSITSFWDCVLSKIV